MMQNAAPRQTPAETVDRLLNVTVTSEFILRFYQNPSIQPLKSTRRTDHATVGLDVKSRTDISLSCTMPWGFQDALSVTFIISRTASCSEIVVIGHWSDFIWPQFGLFVSTTGSISTFSDGNRNKGLSTCWAQNEARETR
jgi:hypothetical protein